jgi:hypothetical protein
LRPSNVAAIAGASAAVANLNRKSALPVTEDNAAGESGRACSRH